MRSLIELIRPEVRNEKPYIVAGAVEVEHKLNQNECPFDIPPDLKKDILESFAKIPFNRYPPAQPHRLVKKLSESLGHPAEGILVGNGSNELTHTLGLCLMSSGSDVVMPRPMFALYESVARLYGATVHGIAPLSDLSFDGDAILKESKRPGVSVTVVTSPNNPTGLSMSFDVIERLCEESAGFVVVDEAYHEFNLEKSAFELLRSYPNLIIIRTLSKAFGLAGVRLGYMMGAPAVMQEFLKARLPFMVDVFAEHVALELLKRPEIVEERVRRMKTGIHEITQALDVMPDVEVVPSQANFVLFRMSVPADVLASQFAKQGVLVRNMSGYPELTGYLRVTTGTEDENKAFFRALDSVRSQS